MLLPLATAYILVGRMKPVVRVLLGYATLVMLAGMTVTFSRGGWVAVTAALLVLLGTLIFHRNHRLPALLLLVILVGGGTVFVTKYLSKTLSYMRHVAEPGRPWNLTLQSASTSGRRRSKCGRIIFGGASGRRITTIVFGNIALKVSR